MVEVTIVQRRGHTEDDFCFLFVCLTTEVHGLCKFSRCAGRWAGGAGGLTPVLPNQLSCSRVSLAE